MTIVMISNKFQGGGEELAQALAEKTRWPMLNRQELQDEARKLGIKVGRLETSMIKRPAMNEKLAREKRLYLAFLTAALCEKAREGNLIYTGRAGHLLLPGVGHRVRVGLTAPMEIRIQRTAQILNLSPDKAEGYLSQLDEDVDKWIRYIHQADGRDPNTFDLFLNLENMSLSHAADIVYQTAVLAEYQTTPASVKALEDLHLASQAKLRLAFDDRTHAAELQVQADNGVLTVTYPPHQQAISGHITKVLADLEACREIRCTMAETNILWVQERFASDSDNFRQILQLAQRWGAAVELMRLLPMGEPVGASGQNPKAEFAYGPRQCPSAPSCGFEEEDDGEAAVDDGGLGRVQEELVSLGRCGGQHTVCGGYTKILEQVQGNGQYALVVIGDLFLSKGHSARTRRTRELAMNIRDRLKAPVITADEMKSRFLFGPRQALTLLGFLAVMVLIYGLVFTHQGAVIDFLNGAFHQHNKWVGSVAVFIFIPIVAYIYGTVTGLALKLINVD
jgi:cytidylate kinase